jgi:SAM-dependent methyltransferase
MQTDAGQTRESPERFDPSASSALLVDAEHRGRYWAIAELARGRDVLDAGSGTGYGARILADAGARSVTGIDVDDEAVAASRAATDGRAKIVQGDIHALPFDTASFDLVVCLEVIEHVSDQDGALAEIARVLRDDGIAVVSSPNRDVYTPGNPHHVHEYTPDELEAALRPLFSSVRLYRQHAWLAAGVLSEQSASEATQERSLPVRLVEPLHPGEETYTIALASKGDAARLGEGIVLARAFEVRWWHDQVVERDRALEVARQREFELGSRLAAVQHRLLELQRDGAEAADMRRRHDEVVLELDRFTKEVRETLAQRDAAERERLRHIKLTSPAWWAIAAVRRLKRMLVGLR